MNYFFRFWLFPALLVSSLLHAQSIDSLRFRIQQIAASKRATVGVALIGPGGRDTLSLNGNGHFPMQSVFKFHIGLAMLAAIDQGKFSLDQKITIRKEELLPDLYSPLREKYPNGATLTIAKIMGYTISQSDNVGCDVLLRLLGGPQAVEAYFTQQQFQDLSIKINEETMQGNWDLQYQNWTTPLAANQALVAFYDNTRGLLSPKSHAFFWKVMRETTTAKNRLRGQLPAKTVVAHKSGWSGANKATGITAAVNDIGVVFLPNGQHFFISVFVMDSQEDIGTNERIIADIAKAVWEYFGQQK